MRGGILGTTIPTKRQQSPGVNPFAPHRSVRTIGAEGGGEGGEGQGGLSNVLRAITTAVSTLGPMIAGLWNKIIGGYTSANGGEVYRQLDLCGVIGQPWCNSYMDWIKTNNPHDTWNTGDIWDYPDTHPTPWKDVYDAYVAAGAPQGILLDANMRPQGLDQAMAAAAAQNGVAQSGGPVPNAEQLRTLQIWALEIAGMSGPVAAQQAAANLAQQPLPWQNYVNALVQIWRNVAAQPNPGGNAGTGDAGTGNDNGDTEKKDGVTTFALAALGAKLLGIF